MQDTHIKQTVETHEVLAFLDERQELTGVASVDVTVLNGWTIANIDLKGRKATDFACLRDCVRERLVEAGYDMRDFELKHPYFL